jgi:hypothetical protein
MAWGACGWGGLLSLGLVLPQVGNAVKETAYARVPLAKAIASHPEIVAYVTAKNLEGETMVEVQRKDREWMEQRDYPLKKTMLQGSCAARLRTLLKDDPVVVEAILMDAKGANVCISAETSDYWQGDEDKWQKTFLDGREVFVDEPALDRSTGVYGVQLSVPVSRDGRRIGALCLTLKIRKELLK